MSTCMGRNCKAVDGNNHSDECIKDHDDIVDRAAGNKPPKCFERAHHQDRYFDNCMYFRECKQCKPICMNNPPSP